jgi:hypothetical protein
MRRNILKQPLEKQLKRKNNAILKVYKYPGYFGEISTESSRIVENEKQLYNSFNLPCVPFSNNVGENQASKVFLLISS